MKKIKIVSMILTVVILITSCNLGMMFTSFADTTIDIDSASDFTVLANKINNNSGTITINLTKNIDASSIGSMASINADGKTIVFNGGNKLIKNLNITGGGLFTNVGANSKFSNLGMYNCTISDFASANKEGYGFLAGKMSSGTIEKCFADGTITVYGGPKYVGGLVGQFGGSMTNSYAMTDIYTDGSYVGGLIGEYTGPENSITACYSTGSIDNDSRNYIGGLIGYSETSCVTNSYTSTCILNPYADTVKSVGVIADLSDTVYYDENLSLQKQGDMDPHRCSPAELRANLTGDGYWISIDGYYPQLNAFCNNSKSEAFCRISTISAAVVDIDRGDGLTTGREFTIVSTTDRYSFATITTSDPSSTAVLPEVNQLEWRISGGIDEYYFDPETADDTGFPTNQGSTIDGLSGNTYDSKTGKYLFVNTGDVKFTACSGNFERDIYVHVTTYDKNPYFPKTKTSEVVGTGTAESPFIINSLEDLDMMRVYCLDDETGKYHYSLSFGTTVSAAKIDFTGIDWLPIVGMKGTLLGNDHNINNMNITRANEGGAGLFATISNNATISDLHISNASVKPTDGCVKAGLLAGTATNANITNVLANGVVEGAENGGMMAGEAYGNTILNTCVTYGVVSASGSAGGMFGTTEDDVKAVDCFSSAVVIDGISVGGFYGSGGGDVEYCIFGGNLAPGLGGIRHGIVETGTVTNSYFDWQAAGIHNSDKEYAIDTATLITPNGVELNSNWDWIVAGGVYHYPQLVYYTNNSDGYTKRSANIAYFSFLYYEGTENGSSVSFDKITVNRKYENGSNRTISALTPYGNVTGDYIIPEMSSQSNPLTYQIQLGTGGRQIYSFANGYTSSSYTCDTRYVMFNVRRINVKYKFSYADYNEQTLYNSDMANKGLTYIESDMGASYGVILDSTITDGFTGVVTISPAGDSLAFDMIHAAKYTYSIEAFADEEMTMPISVYDGNLVSIAGIEDVYVNFIIERYELPWGIYRLNCSPISAN